MSPDCSASADNEQVTDGWPAGWYVVVSGPPGSGKTTLATALAPALGLPLIAKDTIKEAPDDRAAGARCGGFTRHRQGQRRGAARRGRAGTRRGTGERLDRKSVV